MKPKIVYKVVSEIEGIPYSSFTGPFRERFKTKKLKQIFCRKYAINKLTKAHPKTFGLFCFDTLENALEYNRNWGNAIYKAKAFNVRKFKKHVPRNLATIIDWWNKKPTHIDPVGFNGVLVCSAIKLIERL